MSEAIQSNFDPALRDTFHLSTFVGCVSKTHSLIQYQTRLYIINMDTISEEFFYQTILNNFGNCGVIHLSVKTHYQNAILNFYTIFLSVKLGSSTHLPIGSDGFGGERK